MLSIEASAHRFCLCWCCRRLDFPVAHDDCRDFPAALDDSDYENSASPSVTGCSKTNNFEFIATFHGLVVEILKQKLLFIFDSIPHDFLKLNLKSTKKKKTYVSLSEMWPKQHPSASVQRKKHFFNSVVLRKEVNKNKLMLEFTFAHSGSSSEAKDYVKTQGDEQGHR